MRHLSTQMTDRYAELNLEELKEKDRQYNPLLRLLTEYEMGKKPDSAQRQPDIEVVPPAEKPDADAE